MSSHPLVVALYPTAAGAAAAARALHAAGLTRDQLSIVARSHDEEGALADQMDASPGADIEDSRTAARLGELSGQLLAAIALVLPGIGPIVTAGPLSAGLGEAAGHVAGSMASVLRTAGVPPSRAEALQRAVHQGSVLLAVHCSATELDVVRDALAPSGAKELHVANWNEGG
jgi:hypothetical protein